MYVGDKDYRTVWMAGSSVFMIEQNLLPFEFRVLEASNSRATCDAIRTMVVRGAGAIGAAAGFAMAQVALEASPQHYRRDLDEGLARVEGTRPTARNLFYATRRVYEAAIHSVPAAVEEAIRIADEDAESSRLIGTYGKDLIPDRARIATHCNAGWLAFVDHGTALSPVYLSHMEGKKVFVYADETRPRGQGARLTAWELKQQGVPHAIIPDNATAWYMKQGKIDLVIVGADRIAANGDTANKIGTLEKAIAAKAFDIPFYVAAPFSTIDKDCATGEDIPIEERDPSEVLYQTGPDRNGKLTEILVCSPGSPAENPAFDVTPADLITAFITDRGVISPLHLADYL